MRWMILIGAVGTLMTATPEIAHGQRLNERGSGDSTEGGRKALERKFRQRFGELIKEHVNLSDEQMSRLEATNRSFERRRRALFVEERQVREQMREALGSEETPVVQERVARLMERTLRLQHDRLDLLEEEQREIAAFMSPVQRAKYFGMQEQLRRRMEEMRNRSPGDSSNSAEEAKRERRSRAMRQRDVPRSDSLR
jgi:periplasmic protein CpxP/Spy